MSGWRPLHPPRLPFLPSPSPPLAPARGLVLVVLVPVPGVLLGLAPVAAAVTVACLLVWSPLRLCVIRTAVTEWFLVQAAAAAPEM